MLLNADLTLRAVSFADEAEWLASPMAGVERRMLERDGDEVARATSVVRYRPSSRFPQHEHELGEEFLVFGGTFADELGAYPAGTYVRNPPGSAHAPSSDEGCVLFVKLRQFHPEDRARVVIDTRTAEWFPGLAKGIAVLPLHGFGSERVSLVRWAPRTRFVAHAHPGGEEMFWPAPSRTTRAATPRARGCATRRAASTSRSPSKAACCTSRSGTCRPFVSRSRWPRPPARKPHPPLRGPPRSVASCVLPQLPHPPLRGPPSPPRARSTSHLPLPRAERASGRGSG